MLNPSFEDITMCPEDVAEIDLAEPWKSATTATPDLLHSCSSNQFLMIPNGGRFFDSFQEARTGEAFAGIFVYAERSDVGMAEYLMAPLVRPLEVDKDYFIEFFISPDISEVLPDVFTDAIGLGFINDDNIVELLDVESYPLEAAIQMEGNVIKSKDEWVRVSGCYRASGNERNIVIGPFVDYEDVIIEVEPFFSGIARNYFFIEDVGIYSLDPLPDSLDLCEQSEVVLDVTFLDAQYQWSTDEAQGTIVVDKPGVYHVSMQIGNCEYYDEVKVVESCACGYFLPNVYSPNNDGINDNLEINFECKSASLQSFVLYDRYGNIFNSIIENNQIVIDQELNGLQSGVYAYVFEYKFMGGIEEKVRIESGSITLLR